MDLERSQLPLTPRKPSDDDLTGQHATDNTDTADVLHTPAVGPNHDDIAHLPVELARRILDLVNVGKDRRTTLVSCVSLCRWWRNVALPYLYARVTVRREKQPRFFNMFYTSPDMPLHIQHLEFVDVKGLEWGRFSNVLSRTPNLRTLILENPDFLGYKHICDVVGPLFLLLPTLPRLENAVLQLVYCSDYGTGKVYKHPMSRWSASKADDGHMDLEHAELERRFTTSSHLGLLRQILRPNSLVSLWVKPDSWESMEALRAFLETQGKSIRKLAVAISWRLGWKEVQEPVTNKAVSGDGTRASAQPLEPWAILSVLQDGISACVSLKVFYLRYFLDRKVYGSPVPICRNTLVALPPSIRRIRIVLPCAWDTDIYEDCDLQDLALFDEAFADGRFPRLSAVKVIAGEPDFGVEPAVEFVEGVVQQTLPRVFGAGLVKFQSDSTAQREGLW